MKFLSSLVFACLLLAVQAQFPCIACVRKPSNPFSHHIPGDHYCDPSATTADILTEFYNALGGASWTNNQNWLTGDYCSWFGITCNQNNDVVTIDLNTNNLKGNQIPPSIGCLTYLQSLILGSNTIFGQIPVNFCNLVNLQYLTLSSNNLGGYIPSCFSNLIFLEHLYLFDNALVGELPDFSGFYNIKEIHVEENCLHGPVPQSIPSPVIIDLAFSYNNFSGCIPDFYDTLLVSFSYNEYCFQPAIPCWLTDADLGCPTVPRYNVQGPFSHCSASCLSVKNTTW